MKKKVFFLLSLIAVGLMILLISSPLIAAYELLGFDHPKEYLVLLQNNMELRASGGFMGSYARIRIEKGKLSLEKIEDIYTPDGQLDGHVDPPWPIQAAFGQGWYKLRDSNWDPDFPTASKTIEWFFEHGKEPKADGLIAVNLSFLQELLKLTGPIYVLDEPEKISYENFYKKTQSAVEMNFFSGSTQKKDFLAKLGRSAFTEIMNLSTREKLQLPKIFWKLLQEREILVYSHDRNARDWLRSEGFDGSLKDIRNSNQDYIALFESNLGSNKANCCIKRTAQLGTSKRDGVLEHQLAIHYENTNPTALKQQSLFWGGAYINFLRIGIPIEAKIMSIKNGDIDYPAPVFGEVFDLMRGTSDDELRRYISGKDSQHLRVDLEKRDDKGIQFIGFFVVVDALNSKDVRVTYSLPEHATSNNEVFVEKQSGNPGSITLKYY